MELTAYGKGGIGKSTVSASLTAAIEKKQGSISRICPLFFR